MTATDPYSGGRNFAGHYADQEVERRAGGSADRGAVLDRARHRAGAEAPRRRRASRSSTAATPARPRATSPRAWSGARARGTSCRSSIIVTNNGCGISTPYAETARRAPHRRPRQGVRHSGRRSSTATIPIASWFAIEEAMATCARSASRTCSRRWSRGSTATRLRRARTSCREEDCLARFENALDRAATSRRAPSSTRCWETLPRGGERRGQAGADRAGRRARRPLEERLPRRRRPASRARRRRLRPDGEHGSGHPHGAHLRRGAPRRHRHLRRGRRPAARRRLHRHPGPQDRVELAARRARHHRHGDGHRLAGPKPVAEIQFCDYAFNTIDLLKLAGNTRWAQPATATCRSS